MSTFGYKWMQGKKYITGIGKSEKEFIFKFPKALVENDMIDTSQSWVFTRLGKNILLLAPKNPDEKTRKQIEAWNLVQKLLD